MYAHTHKDINIKMRIYQEETEKERKRERGREIKEERQTRRKEEKATKMRKKTMYNITDGNSNIAKQRNKKFTTRSVSQLEDARPLYHLPLLPICFLLCFCYQSRTLDYFVSLP